jgi:SAM-dependent methyltransferase
VGREFAVASSGITLPDWVSGPVDVLFDGERIWSFNPARDARRRGDHQLVPWPQPLRPYLEGVTEASLVSHVDGESLFSTEARFGKGTSERIRLVDPEGHPLALDKGGRLQRTFSNTGAATREQIVDAVDRVLRDLREECELDAYLSYGCLLGAVRDGHMIGHDSDADVSYISKYTHPFDIIRESYRAYRVMRRRGWRVVRMSGADFKVWVPLPDGRRCGIDVFGSFHIGEYFHVMGSLRGHLDRSVVLPLGTVTLEGRELPAPHRPEEFLEFTYGPGWRVPDPAFHFDHDRAVVRRMDAWFRAARRRYRLWHDFYKSRQATKVPTEPSRFACWAQERLPAGAHVLDAGCGNGRDAVWLAAQGHPVVGLDFAGTHRPFVQRLAKEHDVKVRHQALNFENLRAVLISGARLAFDEHTHEVYARGLLDALSDDARANFWRWASMVQRRGGRTYVEFRTPASRKERKLFGPHYRQFLDPADVVREIEERGGHVTEQVIGRDLAPLGFENPEICRLVVRWQQ